MCVLSVQGKSGREGCGEGERKVEHQAEFWNLSFKTGYPAELRVKLELSSVRGSVSHAFPGDPGPLPSLPGSPMLVPIP